MSEIKNNNDVTGLEVAVIGMAGRFPGASTIDELWTNLLNGVESISFFSEEELLESGVSPDDLQDPHHVRAGSVLENIDHFDALFFGYSPREAQLLEPQMRFFHECAWTALEDAAYNPHEYSGSIGLYAGAAANHAWQLLPVISGKSRADRFLSLLFSDKDFLASRIAFNLNLKGPSTTIYTACSTSLVAIHTACRALLSGECDMALAGGITLQVPHRTGFFYHEKMINSADGHVRSFSSAASGTLFGNGVGVVVLKLLEDALSHGDHIYAVVKGTAANNDGNRKISYTAPSAEGQAEVIAAALEMAELEPERIGYIEAHGSGTKLGDSLEIEGLTRAFNTQKKGYCALGSVKTNLGHLDTAAGVTGFIKTVLILKNGLIPPSLHFEQPNPEIHLEITPFYINRELNEWKPRDYKRIAGVSSFGVGGTNAHVILEEAPLPERSPAVIAGKNETENESENYGEPKYQLLLLSARTGTALEQMTANLAGYIRDNPGVNLADVAYTLQAGRKSLAHRRMLVCSHGDEAAETLLSPHRGKVRSFTAPQNPPSVVFMFPGVGSAYVNMGRELYLKEPIFREEIDRCFEILNSLIGLDIKTVLYPEESSGDSQVQAGPIPGQWEQPLIFILEYALAKLLMHWGIRPQALIGYSLGEYTAACLAGVFSLENGLTLLMERGRLIQSLHSTDSAQRGCMISVPLPREELQSYLAGIRDLSLAIDNGESCIAAGPFAAVETLENQLKEKRVMCVRLEQSWAVHSQMMNPILPEFEKMVDRIPLQKPQIRYISNVTGDWLTDEQAVDPGYWTSHLRQTVRFAEGIKELLKERELVFLEVGPGHDLVSLITRYIDKRADCEAVNTLRPVGRPASDLGYLLNRLGMLWLYGVTIDWASFYWNRKMQRISLPTYPFESKPIINPEVPKRLDAVKVMNAAGTVASPARDISQCFYIPGWKRIGSLFLPGALQIPPDKTWLIFVDNCGLGQRLGRLLGEKQQQVITVTPGEDFRKAGPRAYTLNPCQDHRYEELFADLDASGRFPDYIVHLWGVTRDNMSNTGNAGSEDKEKCNNSSILEQVDSAQDLGFYSVLNIGRAAGKKNTGKKIILGVVTDGMQDVSGEETLQPGKRTLLGPVKVLPLEFTRMSCFSLDVVLPEPDTRKEEQLLQRIIEEFNQDLIEPVIALRGNYKWVETFEPVRIAASPAGTLCLKERGVYLITGGLGGIGFLLAQHLAGSYRARLILTGRWGLSSPDRQLPQPPRTPPLLESLSQEEKQEKVRALEKLGAEVLVLKADAADQDQVEEVIRRVREEFGVLHGVIHCAGLPDGAAVSLRTREMSRDILAPKVRGTLLLDRALSVTGLEPDFFVLCSSMASIWPGFGQVAYSGANAFLDAFARSKNTGSGVFYVSIDWDRWIHVGVAVILEDLFRRFSGQEPTGGITPEQGVQAFTQILGSKYHQVAVSTLNPNDLKVAAGTGDSVGSLPLLPIPGEPDWEESSEKNAKDSYAHPRFQSDNEIVAPQTRIEQGVARAWQELFAIPQVSIDEDFFQLGGDSLKAIVLLSVLNQRFNIELGLADILNRPTVKEQARYIERCTATGQYSSSTGIEAIEKREFYRIPYNVKRLWIINQLEPGSLSYNMPDRVAVDRDVNPDVIQEVLKKLMRRHEALRSCFREVEGEPVLVVDENAPLLFKTQDISGLPGADRQQERDRIFAAEASVPFDLATPPLFRVLLLKWDDMQYDLIFNFHHIITDGWSMEVLKRDFFLLYEHMQVQPGFDPQPLKFQYKDFSAWQLWRAQNPGIKENAHRYWLSKLEDDLPPLYLPMDFPRQRDVKDMDGASYTFMLSEGLTDKLKKMAKDNKTTLFMVMFAIYNIFLSKLSAREEVVCSIINSGREYRQLHSIIGYFVNPVIVKTRVEPEHGFGDFLHRLNVGVLEAFQHQAYPYELVLEDLKMSFPDIPVSFNMYNVAAPQGMIDSFVPFHDQSRSAYFDLETYILERSNGMVIDMTYRKALFKPETIEYIAGGFLNLVDFFTGTEETGGTSE